jgi:hypothetical protein
MSKHLYSITTPELFQLTSEQAIFTYQRRPIIKFPQAKELVIGTSVTVSGLLACLGLMLYPFQSIGILRYILYLVFAFGWFAVGIVYLFFLWQQWTEAQEAQKLCPKGFFAVKFKKATKKCTLVGPISSINNAPYAETPLLAQIAFEEIKLFDEAGPSDPWTDNPGDYDSARLYFWINKPPHPDLSQHFDLLDGITADHRWHVSLHNAEYLERRDVAKELFYS